MTTTQPQLEERLAQIHSRGYWRVIIHPTEFNERRIASLAQCWDIVDSAKVNLRWSLTYPTVNPDSRVNGNDWVQSSADWYGPELWRFYQSGQFVHHFAVFEDWVSEETGEGLESNGARPDRPRTLNTFNALFTITEILEFAGRLAYRDVLAPEALVRIELHGMQGRQLVPPPGVQMRFGAYVSQSETISWSTAALSTELITRSDDLARDATACVFERFNWNNPSRSLLEQEQRRLRERRL